MEQAETIQRTDATKPFWMPSTSGFQTPAHLLCEENESLKQIIAFQDVRIAELLAEQSDLHRLLGLRGEAAVLEQQIEQRNTEEED